MFDHGFLLCMGMPLSAGWLNAGSHRNGNWQRCEREQQVQASRQRCGGGGGARPCERVVQLLLCLVCLLTCPALLWLCLPVAPLSATQPLLLLQRSFSHSELQPVRIPAATMSSIKQVNPGADVIGAKSERSSSDSSEQAAAPRPPPLAPSAER